MPQNETTRNPLNVFADKWTLDGDYLRCRICNRPQHISFANHDFQHHPECHYRPHIRSPWRQLGDLIADGVRVARPEPVKGTANAG